MSIFRNLLCMFLLFGVWMHVSTSYAQSCPTDKPIVLGDLDWDSSRFATSVVKTILEKGYGCNVETVPGSTIPLTVATGRGDVHVLMEVWLQVASEAWKKVAREGKAEVIGTNFDDAEMGFYVPRYMIEGDKKRPDQTNCTRLKKGYGFSKI